MTETERIKQRLQARHRELTEEVTQELLAVDDARYTRLAESMGERMEGVDKRVADRFRRGAPRLRVTRDGLRMVEE